MKISNTITATDNAIVEAEATITELSTAIGGTPEDWRTRSEFTEAEARLDLLGDRRRALVALQRAGFPSLAAALAVLEGVDPDSETAPAEEPGGMNA